MRFSSHITRSIRSATAKRVALPLPTARRSATALITSLRGSFSVYTGWPKPMTTSLAATRRRMSVSAPCGSS